MQEAPQTSKSSTPIIIVILLVLVMLIWQWLHTRQQLNQLELTLSQRLEQFNEKNQQSLALAKNADERSANTLARTSLLEQQFEKSLDQQQALQTLYSEFANNREERAISEVEQLLMIANQQLQLNGNLKPALIALQSADARLSQLDTPQAIQLRKSLNQHIQALQNVPTTDSIGMSLKLEALTKQIDQLPTISIHQPSMETATTPPSEVHPWQKLTQEIWQDIKSMVLIERIDHPQTPLLTAEQSFFLRETIKLHLLTARMALLQRDEATYRADLNSIQQWVTTYFDQQAPVSKNFLAMIKELSANQIIIQMPDISDNLALASAYKLSLEHVANNTNNKPAKVNSIGKP